jgi:hypothetical protein
LQQPNDAKLLRIRFSFPDDRSGRLIVFSSGTAADISAAFRLFFGFDIEILRSVNGASRPTTEALPRH